MTRNAITPPPYKTDNQLVADKGDRMEKFSIIDKITFALAAIVIAAVSLFLVSLLSGCDSAGYAAAPVDTGCVDNWDEAFDAGVLEERKAWEKIPVVAKLNSTIDELEKTKTQLAEMTEKANCCDSATAGLFSEKLDCEKRLSDEQQAYMGEYYRAEDALDVIATHLDVVALCDAGEIKYEWLCKAAYDGKL